VTTAEGVRLIDVERETENESVLLSSSVWDNVMESNVWLEDKLNCWLTVSPWVSLPVSVLLFVADSSSVKVAVPVREKVGRVNVGLLGTVIVIVRVLVDVGGGVMLGVAVNVEEKLNVGDVVIVNDWDLERLVSAVGLGVLERDALL
jgi:hypothetical protein